MSSFNASIHGARGLFAVMVFAFHVANSGLPTFLSINSPVEQLFFLSLKFGVELFFGISGFVIVGALARAPSIRSFLWDRATRIYPLLWITLLAITAVSLATGRWLPPLGQWLLNFLAPPPFFALGQVNPAAWSLGYEVTFYSICAGWWQVAGKGHRWWRWGAVLSAVVLLAFFPRAVLMPAGVLIAAGLVTNSLVMRAASFPGIMLLAFLLLWRAIELIAPGQDISRASLLALSFAHWLAMLPLLIVGGACGLLALNGIAQQRGMLGHLLRTPSFQWLGTISFSFYLWHPVVMSFAKTSLKASGFANGPLSQLIFAVVALPPSLLIAHASQRWIEVTLTRRLRAFGPREARPHAPITAIAGDPDAYRDVGEAPGVRV